MTWIYRIVCLLVLLAAVRSAEAQLPTVDITLRETGTGLLEVRVRPDAFFDGVFSAVVFTVRWNEADGVALGPISQMIPQAVYCGVAPSGEEQTDGYYRYQVFAGFGSVALSTVSTAWQGGEEIVLCSIEAPLGSSVYSLVNDDWTLAANGNYYVSLNGESRTGEIYSSPTEVHANTVASGPKVTPNPSNGQVVLSVPDALAGTLSMELVDASGRMVWKDQRNIPATGANEALDLGMVANGVYTLKLVNGSVTLAHRLVIDGVRR